MTTGLSLWEPFQKVLERDRAFGFTVDGRWISTCGAYSRSMTVPGGSVPVAAVTVVTVSPAYRRRGLLTADDEAPTRGHPPARYRTGGAALGLGVIDLRTIRLRPRDAAVADLRARRGRRRFRPGGRISALGRSAKWSATSALADAPYAAIAACSRSGPVRSTATELVDGAIARSRSRGGRGVGATVSPCTMRRGQAGRIRLVPGQGRRPASRLRRSGGRGRRRRRRRRTRHCGGSCSASIWSASFTAGRRSGRRAAALPGRRPGLITTELIDGTYARLVDVPAALQARRTRRDLDLVMGVTDADAAAERRGVSVAGRAGRSRCHVDPAAPDAQPRHPRPGRHLPRRQLTRRPARRRPGRGTDGRLRSRRSPRPSPAPRRRSATTTSNGPT